LCPVACRPEALLYCKAYIASNGFVYRTVRVGFTWCRKFIAETRRTPLLDVGVSVRLVCHLF
jgi:hypothetical protein